MVRTGLLVVVFLGAARAAGLAQTAGDYGGARWSQLDAPAVMKAAATVTLAKYPDCDDATIDKKMMRVYRADGTGESQDETFTKVLTEKGKRNNRTLSLGFMLPYFTAEVVKLEVIRPSGEVIPVDIAANSKEVIDDSQMAMNIYDPNSKILRVSIPKVEIDDVVHSVTRLTVKRAIMEGEFAEENVLEGPGYLRHLSYEVVAPAAKPLQRLQLRDEVAGTVKYQSTPGDDQTTVHHWEVANVPRMFDEPAMPPYENSLQRLIVSTTADWKQVSQWYWNLSEPHLGATVPEMTAAVEKLTKDAKTPVERMKAIFYDVSKNVRYMGLTPEKDRPGFEPHDVKLTFEKKYGVCRDKAGLLVSLLRTAGLPAFPVLINVGTKMDPDAPTPFFNHAIVAVETSPGEYTLMDPTDENTKELLPAMDRNQSFLVCRPEGEGIKVSPVNPAEENLMTIHTTGTLSVAGGLEARTEVSFAGINDNVYRQAFAQMKADDRRRFVEMNLKRILPGSRLKSLSLTPENMLDTSVPIHAVIEYAAEGLTANGSGKSMVGLPWVGKTLGIFNYLLGGAGLEKRKYTMQTFVTCGLREELSLRLGDGFTGAVSMPAGEPIEDASVRYTRHYTLQDNVLSASREVALKVVEFNPTEYLKLKEAMKALDYDARKMPILSLADQAVTTTPVAVGAAADSAVESNARIVESHKDIEIKDAHTSVLHARYRKEILSYAGKKDEAEIKVDYNPSCQEARIVRAVVTSKTGQRQEISKDEINAMDAGWNASATRYTGGKVLVANLPGVEIGSTIEVEYEITTKNGLFIAGFEAFQLRDVLESKQVIVTAPADLPIHRLLTGQQGAVVEQLKSEAGSQSFDWHSTQAKALPAERETPPSWTYLSGVGYFAGDAAAYYRELGRAMTAHSAKRDKVAAAVALLVTGKSKLEALAAVRDFVAKSIRSAGPSFTELPLTELSDADRTLADGYGHEADRAILCHAMLTAAGFAPEFVLASGLPPISAITNVTVALPLPETFQTPLVRVVVDGQSYYLNDTDQYARLGATAHDGRMAVALATQSPTVIHAVADCLDKVETVYSLSFTDSGKTRIGVSRRYFGGDFGGRNRFFSELPPEEKRRYFQEAVSAVSQGARPVADLATHFDAYPGVEEFAVEVDNYAVVDGRYFYFGLPFVPSLFPPGADHRFLPLFVSHATRSTIRTEMDLPASFKKMVIAPATEELVAPDGSGRVRTTSQVEGTKYVLTHEFTTSPAIIAPADYPELLKLQAEVGRKSSRTFLLQAGEGEAVKAAP